MVSAAYKLRVPLACLLAATAVLPGQFLRIVEPGTLASSGPDVRYIRNLVSGRVVVGGGAAPRKPVSIGLVCGDWFRPKGLTDVHGRFKFRPERHADVTASLARTSSSAGGGAYSREILYLVLWPEDLLPCFVTAELAGYRSVGIGAGLLAQDGVTLVGDASSVDVGFIVLHRFEDFEGYARSATTSLAPSSARNSYKSGLQALRRANPNYKQAASHFEKAAEAYPEFAGAWSALGAARFDLGDEGGALQAFTRSINADPDYLMPYEIMMEMVLRNQNWEELEWLVERYLEMSSNAPMVLYMGVFSSANLDKFSLVEDRLMALEKLSEKDYWAKGHIILARKHEDRTNFKGAAKSYEAILSVYPNHSTAETMKRRLYEWQKLNVIEPRSKPNAGKTAP